jgi:urease accessory protein
MSSLARLLHLTDSALPTGSFAYSYGLESSATFGLLPTAGELRAYLYSFLQQVAGVELPFATAAATAAPVALEALLLDYDALLLVPALHRASLTQGKTWLRLLTDLYPDAGLAALATDLEQQQLPLHFAPVFGLTLARAGFAVPDLQTAYLHLALRDQVSAAIRLGLLGPLAGHRLQHAFYGIFDELLQAAGQPVAQAGRSTPLLEIAQLLHDDLYSRLFQN